MSDLPPCETDSFDRCFERALGSPITWRIVAVCAIALLVFSAAHARDLDGRYAASPLKPWFDSLRSGKGPCCSDADGSVVKDPDWETAGGHYRVRVGSEWLDVPDDAVITESNRFGQTMVWPMYQDGKTQVRCFLPGSMM